MVTIKVTVFNFYDHPIYFFYLSKRLFETFNREVRDNDYLEETSDEDFNRMINAYFDTLKN